MRCHWAVSALLGFHVLGEAECCAIHCAALEVLNTTGMSLQETQALRLLHAAGARVRDGRVKVPSSMVEEAIRSAPSRITVFDREGTRALSLEDHKSYFGAQSDLITYVDLATGERRDWLSQDTAMMTRLADGLPNIDFTLCGSAAYDYPPEVMAQVAFAQTVANTTKPITFFSADITDLSDIVEMAAIVAGGPDRLAERPFIVHYAVPISPLTHYGPAVRKLLLCAEREIPVIYAPMLQGGATAPATFGGILVQGVAESLAGLVIHQLKRRGAPFILGAIPTHFEMRTMIPPYGAPELHLLSAAMAQMGQYYGLPTFGTAGCTDAKEIDAQAGAEAALSVVIAALSGANLIHDVGLMDHATVLSPDFLVYGDEVIAMVKNYFRPIGTDPDGLALDVIDQVGPGGHFLEHPHTLKHFREDWYPDLFDRSSLEQWLGTGRRPLAKRLQRRTEEILGTHMPKPLSEKTARELESLQKRWLSKDPIVNADLS